MSDNRFQISEVIGLGWSTLKANVKFFIGMVLIVWAFYIIPNIMQELTKENLPAVSALLSLAAWFLQSAIGVGMVKIALSFTAGQRPVMGELFAGFSLPVKTLKFMAASFLYGAMVFLGFILLIVPGIIVAVRFQFLSYYIVDQDCGPIEALKKSFELTKGATKHLILLGLASMGITLLGILALIIGLFAAMPTVMIAYAYTYRRLQATQVKA